MEFPFGHHHHHHRRDDAGDGEEYPEEHRQRYPPPPYAPDPYAQDLPPPRTEFGCGEEEFAPPPRAAVFHVAHEVPNPYAQDPPPRTEFGRGEEEFARPPPTTVFHVAHEAPDPYAQDFPPPRNEVPSDIRHHRPVEEMGPPEGYRHDYHHHRFPGEGGEDGGTRKSTVRVFTRAAEDFSLSIRNGTVILARADPNDEYQHWIKDLKYSTRVKDEEGLPSFALINKVTGEAIKHSIGSQHPVRLVPYDPEYLDESVLWTESYEVSDGFRCIRMVNNIGLNFDAFHGDEDHGGVHDGTTVVLWEWLKGKNQQWKIVPYEN